LIFPDLKGLAVDNVGGDGVELSLPLASDAATTVLGLLKDAVLLKSLKGLAD
jgi:hypothetical protein